VPKQTGTLHSARFSCCVQLRGKGGLVPLKPLSSFFAVQCLMLSFRMLFFWELHEAGTRAIRWSLLYSLACRCWSAASWFATPCLVGVTLFSALKNGQ
jgi:hypothetical protein